MMFNSYNIQNFCPGLQDILKAGVNIFDFSGWQERKMLYLSKCLFVIHINNKYAFINIPLFS